MSQLSAHLELRLATLRSNDLYVGRGAAEQVERFLRPFHEDGEVHALGDRAFFAWRRDENNWLGVPMNSIAFDHAPGADVRPWLSALLPDVLARVKGSIDLPLDRSYVGARSVLMEHGLSIDSLQLLGDVATASKGLGPAPWPDDVKIMPMTNANIGTVLDLYQTTFQSEPEYCWFCGTEGYRRSLTKELVAALAGEHLEFIIRSDSAVGHCAVRLNLDHPKWGASGGVTLCLPPELRQRGLLRPIYRRLLDGLTRRGARTFLGATSQPPVMHLSQLMERSLKSWCMRRGAPFEAAHFDRFYPPDIYP